MMPRLRLLMLDLDGTLIESLSVKDAAFARLYADAPRLDEIMAYHRSHNHVVRFDKFRHISEHFFGTPLSTNEDARLRESFARFVVNGLIACPEVTGARSLLDEYKGVLPMILISRSPDSELRHVLSARGLSPYFEEIYSADWSKPDAISDALSKQNVLPTEAVYVGDSPEDAKAAAAAGVVFIGRQSERDLCGLKAPIFADMASVHAHLATSYTTE